MGEKLEMQKINILRYQHGSFVQFVGKELKNTLATLYIQHDLRFANCKERQEGSTLSAPVGSLP